ncbi:MAG TPA: amino acid adenylation domain-containing protein [Ktedonobacteraceae bacterium]
MQRNPLFEIMLNLTNMPRTTPAFSDLTLSDLQVIEPEAKFSLTLYIEEQAGGLHLQAVYQRDLFSAEHIYLLLQQFQYLLEQIVTYPEQSVGAYSLVTPESRLLLPDPLEMLPEPRYEPVPGMIAAWAARTPDQLAIRQAGMQWSYHELLKQAETIARTLVALGVRQGDIVAIVGLRSFGLIAALVGVLMSGAAFLSLDRALPLRRKQIMLQSAAARYLVRMDEQEESGLQAQDLAALTTVVLHPDSGRVVAMDKLPDVDPHMVRLPEVLPAGAAYLIFTSGTTGVPRGVLGYHKSLSHFLTWQRETFAMAPGDSSAQLTGFSFDMVLRDIFLALVSGATLCLPEADLELAPGQIIIWLAREQISTLHIVPTLAQSWLSNAPAGVALPALRSVFFAGEPLTGLLVRRWRQAFGAQAAIINLYGPTETTQSKCWYRVPAEVQPGVQAVGWPLPEAQALVMGPENRLCGIGEPGEIVIRTPFRTAGYINAAEENQRRFVKNPFRDDDQDVLYRSGDRGRYGPDGRLHILGRIDQQIKLRGIRIEPREIEVILMQHPAVQDAVVVLYQEPLRMERNECDQRDEYLLAYIVLASAQQPAPREDELQRYLQVWLPTSMVPSAFIVLPALPLTLNGKLDRRALPLPERLFQGNGQYRVPRTPTEELVAGIWAQVLKRDVAVGMRDNFFALGGHSLSGVQIISRLRHTFQVDLPLRSLFETPTITGLAQRIEQVQSSARNAQTLPIAPIERSGPLPLSFTQQRLWFLDQWEPDNPFFNISRSLALHGPLVVTVWEESLHQIIQRHEALRTNIVALRGRPMQVIAAALALTLPVLDLSTLAAQAREAEIQRLTRAEARRPFDLSQDPLIRTTLLRLHKTEHVFLLTLHHIIADAWSLGLFLQELGTLYDASLAQADTRRTPLPALPIQYVDFTIWQQEMLHQRLPDERGRTVLEQQLLYWREHLKGAPPLLALPTDRRRPPRQTFQGALYHFTLPQALTSDLKALSQREGVTLFMTLLAAFQTQLLRYTGQEDLVIGSTNANRTRLEIENLIGCFFDIQALRTDLSGNPPFRTLLGRVRDVTLGAYAHQDLPFGKVVEELQPERSLSHSPLFQVAFALQHLPVMAIELANLTLNMLETETGAARLDLMVFLAESEQKLMGVIEYNTDLFEQPTMARFAGHYQRLLKGIVAHPEQRLADLPLLTEVEREQLLGAWSRTASASLRTAQFQALQQRIGAFLESAPDRRVYLLDAYQQPVPVGVPAELYIGYAGQAHASLTPAEPSLPDPSGDQPGSWLYRTGELASYSQSGTITYVGRADRQMEVQGYRIQPEEIEALLAQYPGVQESTLSLYEDEHCVRRLVAYIVPGPQSPALCDAELRRYLEKRVPDYLLPASFLFLENLPRTAGGQVDRLALPAPEWKHSVPRETSQALYTPIETALLAIWTDLLDVESAIGIHADFFALGGHSLLATQVMSRVQEVFQVALPLYVFFEAATIAELAQRIAQARQISQGQRTPPPVAVPRTGPLPLSFAQERLWFLEQLASQSAAYTMLSARRIRGPLDISALERSLALLVQRHEALRTTFVIGEHGPVQIIAPTLEIPLRVSDLTALPAEKRETQARRLATLAGLEPFDLSQGPLLRARLLCLEEGDFVLLIALHHIVSDGWSQGVFYRELADFYTALCEDQPASLPSLPLQYADYAVWQRNVLQDSVLEEQVTYWRERLLGAPALLDLPTDHPRPPVQSFSGATSAFHLPAMLVEQIRVLSQQEEVTLFMTLLAAFQVLLQRYSGQEDLVIGSPIANRSHLETEGLIGFFVNTLLLRTHLAGNPSFRRLLAQVREVCLGAYVHQDLPFEKLVEILQPERSLSYNPLFQVLFALQNAGPGALQWPGGTLEPFVVESRVAKFDLSLYLTEGQDGELQGAIEYSTDVFAEATIRRLIGDYQRLLEAIVATPERRIGQLPLLSLAQWEQIVWQWNATQAPYPQEACLPQLFEKQAMRTPEAVALLSQEHCVTYGELNVRANRLAHALRELKVGPETRVGVCLWPAVEVIMSILGILKAGGAYVPLDPAYPLAWLAFAVQDAHVQVVLTQSSLLARLPPGPAHLLCLDTHGECIAQQPAFAPDIRVQAENLAYVIYTSGSTGRPKGVLATHRATINRLSWMWRTYPFAPDEVCCQKTSLSFVDAVWEIFGPLLQGIPTVLLSPAHLQDPQELLEALAREAVTRIVLVPSLLQALLSLEEHIHRRVPGLRFWVTSGEALSLELLKGWQKMMPAPSVLLNLYGSCEVAADATCCEVTSRDRAGTGVPIGRPVANTQAYILDAQMYPVPVGGQGELYIGGAGVARGYLGHPDLTAAQFIPHPYSQEPGRRLYRTGDRARYLRTGEIEFLGRADDQVKIRGVRIETGEVEATLNQHQWVQQAVVLAREERPGAKQLVAYVLPSPGATLSLRRLRRYLQERLPAYMLPAAFVLLEAWPLLPNGKIDRQALPAPRRDRTTHQGSAREPSTPRETALAAIWAEVLQLEQVGRHANFFELGGDSILTIQVVLRARRAGLQLTPRHLFQYQTIAALAEAVAGEEQEAAKTQPQEPRSTRPEEHLERSYTPADFPLAGLDQEEFRKLADLLGATTRLEELS